MVINNPWIRDESRFVQSGIPPFLFQFQWDPRNSCQPATAHGSIQTRDRYSCLSNFFKEFQKSRIQSY